MNKDKFSLSVLRILKVPATPENLRFMKAWYLCENTTALNNPFATTQNYTNATNFNSTGVKNYLTEQDGIIATVKTLSYKAYRPILAALKMKLPASIAVQTEGVQTALNTWGTTGKAVAGKLTTTQPVIIDRTEINPFIFLIFAGFTLYLLF